MGSAAKGAMAGALGARGGRSGGVRGVLRGVVEQAVLAVSPAARAKPVVAPKASKVDKPSKGVVAAADAAKRTSHAKPAAKTGRARAPKRT